MDDAKLHVFYSQKMRLCVCCFANDFVQLSETVDSGNVLIGIGETEEGAKKDFEFKLALRDNKRLDNIY